jgi:proteic killer suppression protein
VRHALRTSELKRLATEKNYLDGYSIAVVKAYRKALQHIDKAIDERDLYVMKSFHFEKLKGDRAHQHSMRLNDQYRLILQIVAENKQKMILVIDIEDYH